ncbi:hypothetical protein DUNSADRAFT_1887 [Dunaliella salina]|uniref:VWFA domain-containing protein n=1 Tax=Dunaliella salina TaxID=3046 RepID=A0ABQ7FWX0_DUNSA|nr:hypothetical protein DUNSADRAFT_1887 [Dunaliella salina]|eukprot:KAF5826843.1 hypothetical protein DUNSADRAFT_1887 [Dunaliella salina]
MLLQHQNSVHRQASSFVDNKPVVSVPAFRQHPGPSRDHLQKKTERRSLFCTASTSSGKRGVHAHAAVLDAPTKAGPPASKGGHTALLHGLGDIGDVAPSHLPWLLRLAHIQSRRTGGDSSVAIQETARGLMAWRAALNKGLLPDEICLRQIIDEGSEEFAIGRQPAELKWPEEPLNTLMIRIFAKLNVAYFARKYPAVQDAFLKSLLEVSVRYHKTLAGEEDEMDENVEVDSNGKRAKTAKQLAEEEAQRRAERGGPTTAAIQQVTNEMAARKQLDEARKKRAAANAALPPERRIAVELARELYGKAGFGSIWKRAGWNSLDALRAKLEDLKELRDLVRSLGRGGGWGPLRRAPIQYLDMSGRQGLLRTVLETHTHTHITRSDDISRMTHTHTPHLSRGRTVRSSKLLFYARLAEKALQSYERDGWSEFPTRISHDRREVRPTADRGPILLCVDTSGSMRGARETIAKALALECMRAAREQERDCYVFAFSGPSEVRELELNSDMKSVNNLLDFIETVFNGGSDFNEPVRRCLDRLSDAKWANSDILLVSDGELRQPGSEVMRKLSGAKDKLSLRVHGLIIGSPEKKRADPAVLRGLCTSTLPNGKTELLVTEFSSWASVQADDQLGAIDYDDLEGNARRRLAGLKREADRQAEMRRRRSGMRGSSKPKAGGTAPNEEFKMPTAREGRQKS